MNDNVMKYNWKERKITKREIKEIICKKNIINKFKEKMMKMHKN